LKSGHFDLLKNESTFGVNRINLIFDDTTWRPTHHVLFDRSKGTTYASDVSMCLSEGCTCLLRADIPRGGEAIYWFQTYGDKFIPSPECTHVDVEHNPTDRWHDAPPICKQGGSIPAAIQWAVQLGYNPIYLIGCDMGLKAHSTGNHFTPRYADVDAYSEKAAALATRNLLHNHSIAKKECARRGVEIYNAGIGGSLDLYKRVEFKSLF
jgi:hypothetical protein